MSISAEHVEDVLESNIRVSDSIVTKLDKSEISFENIPTSLKGLGDTYREVGNCHGLLGNQQRAREAYAEGAEYYRDAKKFVTDHRDELDGDRWEDAPAYMTNAVECAVISRERDVIEEVATETLSLNESYIERFTDEYEDSPFRFYNAKLYAAFAIQNDERDSLMECYWDATEPLENKKPEVLGEFYQALGEQNIETVSAYIDIDHYNDCVNTDSATVSPEQFVDDENLAYCLLANDWEIRVTFDSPYIPDVLLPDRDTAEHVIKVDL